MNTSKLVINALFIALHIALCYVSIKLGNMTITVSGLPIILGGMMFGPIAGLEIGLIGSFLNQMLQYGLTATTVIWVLPAAIRGLMIGAYARRHDYHLERGQLFFIIVFSAMIVTLTNTAAMYIDSKVYGYYSYAYVFGMTIPRIISAILTSAVYLAVVEVLMKHLAPLAEQIRQRR